MPPVSETLDGFAAFLDASFGPFSEGPHIMLSLHSLRGTLDGIITFPDGCEVHISLRVNGARQQHAQWEQYAFHCQDRDGQCVARFDNAPHHRNVATFPHHLHRGADATVFPQTLPTGRRIVEEIMSHHSGHGLA